MHAPRAALFLLCLLPFLKLAWDAARGDLTANPIENLTHRTGFPSGLLPSTSSPSLKKVSVDTSYQPSYFPL